MGQTSFDTCLRVLTLSFLEQEHFSECIGIGFSTVPQPFSKQSYPSQHQQLNYLIQKVCVESINPIKEMFIFALMS